MANTLLPEKVSSSLIALKRVIVGRPISSHRELSHRLSKRIALAVFSSDALSSSAYATDEILLVLMAAGSGVLRLSIPISLSIVFVLAVVVVSYRQTVRAYPGGGGAYIVAHDNIGPFPGLIAASSLLIDYVLTVAVSVAAGVAAVNAAFPALEHNRVPAALAVVGLITLLNLRGLRESGRIFAVPTYGFLLAVGTMIIVGAARVLTGNYTPVPRPQIEAEHALGLFVVLRAFASGSTALTGIEAISNGVPAFRPSESRNAATTLGVLGLLLSFLFLGITFLANAYQVDPGLIERGGTVPSQVARGVFGGGSAMFFLIQAFTALILFLAANTSYADFPRLASILAHDRYLPRVFRNRGDKLAFSNGIIILAVASAAVVVHYDAAVHRIIPLYVIGVFTSFTLSQTGMVVRWFRLKGKGWRRSAAVNAFGGLTTFVVLLIVGTTKFALGAWQVMILIPTVAWLLHLVGRHYAYVADELRIKDPVPPITAHKVVMLVSPVPGATLKALGFARAFGPKELHVVGFRVPERRFREVRRRWQELGIKSPIEATGHRLSDLIEYVDDLDPSETEPVTVVIPDPQYPSRIHQVRINRRLLGIKRAFVSRPGVVVTSVPFRPDVDPDPRRLEAPGRLSVIVLVSAVHRGTLRALEYARSLQPAELQAVIIGIDPEEGPNLISQWHEWAIGVPIRAVDSPYRSLVGPLLDEVRSLRPNPGDAVAVVVPAFVLPHWWQRLLHNQTALLIKAALLFERNVVVVSVPSVLRDSPRKRFA